jgi:hypothetical protein
MDIFVLVLRYASGHTKQKKYITKNYFTGKIGQNAGGTAGEEHTRPQHRCFLELFLFFKQFCSIKYVLLAFFLLIPVSEFGDCCQ